MTQKIKHDPKEHAKLLKTAYSSIFKGEMGKIVMKDLQVWCHVDKTSFVPGKSDVTDFNEGKRFIYLLICQMAKIDIDKIMARSDNPEV